MYSEEETVISLFFYFFNKVNPHMMSNTPRSISQAFGGRKKAHIVTMPNTRRTKPMSLVFIYAEAFLFAEIIVHAGFLPEYIMKTHRNM